MKNKNVYTASIADTKAKEPKGERSYTFRTIAIDNITENGGNIRKVEGISDLVSSIQAHGIINPITVTSDFGMKTKYRVIAGFRRLAAAKEIGLETIPCHVIDKEEDGIDEMSLTENITRMDMTPYEECMAVKHLISKKNTVQKVARKFGRTVRWVLVRKKLADAGEKVMEMVMDGDIQLGAAAKLADLPDDVFKQELEDCWSLTNYDVERILRRYHMDLDKAPFDTDECRQSCPKCSAAQADLFEDEPKAYCLDPVCWQLKVHDAATAKVEALKAEGRDARTGNINDYEDDAYMHQIRSYNLDDLKKAEEAGVQKRVLVNPDTAEVSEYYDERDLPDYHEVTDEEREAERKERDKKRRFEKMKDAIYGERLIDRIESVVEAEGNGPAIVTILAFSGTDWLDDAAMEKFDIDNENACGAVYPEDIPDNTWDIDIAELAREHVKDILDDFDIKSLKALYRMIIDDHSRDNLDQFQPTDEEVQKAIEEEDAAKNKESEDEEEDDA